MVHESHSCGWQGSRQLELRYTSIFYVLVTLSKFTLLRSIPVPAQQRDGASCPSGPKKEIRASAMLTHS